MELTNNGTLVGSMDGICEVPPNWWHWFYRECGENNLAPHRGWLQHPLVVAVPPPLFAFFVRGESLLGRNCGIQKCGSVDPLSLVNKCLGGEGYKLRDLEVLMLTNNSFPPEAKSTHTTTSSSSDQQCSPSLPCHCSSGLAVLLSCWRFIGIASSVLSTFNLVIVLIVTEGHHHHYFLPPSAAPPSCNPSQHRSEG
jgi:hypothetical protein